ncbi:hypothetical protein THRCLA_20637 [Thraustotheca clavata]|uniref:Uncharacterized protein n=1 Tax=Thraustotheca clavata TaxID=74557 RepID=A0A1W0A5T0_9STRA|nr:hypothetical protein THRCLA_20637 [Thraustotheca clavata]
MTATIALMDINQFIQTKMIAAVAYLLDLNGDYRFYAQIRENTSYYACQIDLSPVPTSLPVGYSRPATGLYSSGGSGLPATAYTPKVVIQANFDAVSGIAAGTFPSSNQTTTQTFYSTKCPQINPVSAYIVRCNLVNNDYTTPSGLLTVFSAQGTTIGDMIDVKSYEHSWIALADSVRSYIEINIVDQLQRPVKFIDPQTVINLLIRERADTKK